MLTQEQKCDIVQDVGFDTWARYAHKDSISKALDKAYAAGMAAGEAKERERADRCDKLMEKLMRHPRPY